MLRDRARMPRSRVACLAAGGPGRAFESIADGGWWIDDIRVCTGSICGSVPDAVFRDGFEPVPPVR